MSISSIALPLFVPADREDRVSKAVAAQPDAVVLDLEDAVAISVKASARDRLETCINEVAGRLPVMVRINAASTEWHSDDLAAASRLPLAAIMLPKSETAAEIRQVSETTGHPVIALVETARGVARLENIAQAAARIAFGSIDYAADLAMDHSQLSLSHARAQIVLASRVGQLPAPMDGVTAAVHDHGQLTEDCRHARQLGFSGKLLIHPAQIAPARAAFQPSEKDIEWAHRILGAVKDGVAIVDGSMVDAPVLARARHILKA